MTVLGMAARSLRQRRLSSALTALSVALGVALVAVVLLLERQAEGAFRRTATGVEILVGGTKGSRVDTLLGTLYHVGSAPGRVAWPFYERLAADPRVEYAVPVALGDRYRGAPVVGTTPDFFDRFLDCGVEGRVLAGGAVAGADTGLAVGHEFYPSHTGLPGDPTHEHETFVVRAVARRTGTAHDRAIWIDLDEFLHLRGHAGLDRGAEVKAVSAILLKTKRRSPLVVEKLLKEINDGTEAQAIRPARVVGELFALVGDARRILSWVAGLVVVVAVLSVAVAIHNTMAERRRELAVLRALGAGRRRLFGMVLLEAALLCGGGALAGLLLGHGGAALAAPALEARTGVRLDGAGLLPEEPLILLVLVAAGCLAGLLPAFAAYRVDVARGIR